MNMIQVLVIEDHPVMSIGTCHLIKKIINDAVFTQVESFWKALEVAGSIAFDLVLMDIAVPGGNSVRMVEKFRALFPCPRLLMFSAYDETIYALPYIKAGAHGFLSKKASEGELKLAVETVLFKNRIYLSDEVHDMALNSYIKPQSTRVVGLDSLSTREREIVQFFYSRMGVSEIAEALNLSTSTINTHRIRIFKKMGVDNLSDLMRIYEQLSERL